jgi:secondary thiamine-phosphate synthase enzyme
LKAFHRDIHIETHACFEFIDITDQVLERVRDSRIEHGMVNIQTRHTTTAIVVNENEPGLLDDMCQVLERSASRSDQYRHNECPPDEPGTLHDNGHSHCRAMLLGASETLNVVQGVVQLGRWQRIFLLELDRPRDRCASVMVFGVGSDD